MRIHAISIGVSQMLVLRQEPLRATQSAIRKRPVSTLASPLEVELSALGLQADEQSDLSVHGGLDKALYAYPIEHWSRWEQALAVEPRAGLFGENLSIEGLVEEEVYLGDQWRIGRALLQVSEPRIPCDKFCAALQRPQAAKTMVALGACGWYLRVLQAAPLAAGMAIEVLPGPRQERVSEAFAFQARKIR